MKGKRFLAWKPKFQLFVFSNIANLVQAWKLWNGTLLSAYTILKIQQQEASYELEKINGA